MTCRVLLSHCVWLMAALLMLPACSTLPRDAAGRRRVYEQRLAKVEFPASRRKLYKTLPPAAPPRPLGRFEGNFIKGREAYRLDDDFVVEMSVIYKDAVGAPDFLHPSGSLRSQVRAILDTTRSIDNLMSSGSPNHPEDIVQNAEIVQQPARDY